MSAFTSALGPFREVSSFMDPQYGRARCLAFLSGASRLAVGYTDGRLQLFEVGEDGPWQLAADSFCVNALAATPDGSQVASAGQDGVVLRQADRGQPVAGKAGEVKSLAFHPDGQLLALGGMDGEVRFVSMGGEAAPADFTAHPQFVEALAFSPDGQWLATAGLDGVRLWDWRKGKRRHVFDVGTSCPKALVFTEEGSTLAVGSEDGVIRRFDVESSGLRGVLPPEEENAGVWTLALSPDGTVLAAGCEDGRIRLWGHSSSVLLRTLEGHEDAVLSLGWEGDTLLASAGRDGSVRLWSSEEEPAWTLPDGMPQAVDGEAGGEEEDSDEGLRSFEEHEERVTALAFHPSGSLLVSADASGHLMVRDLSGEEETVPLHAHEGEVSRVGFSPDGTLLVTTSAAGGLRVFEVENGEERAHGTHPSGVVALAFHPEKPMLYTGSGGTVRFWDVRPGREARNMPLHDVPGEVTALAMRSDGKSLAVGSQFGSIASISLVPLGEGEQQEPWVLQGTHVHALAFSPDGTRLAAGLEEGRVQLWELGQRGCPRGAGCAHRQGAEAAHARQGHAARAPDAWRREGPPDAAAKQATRGDRGPFCSASLLPLAVGSSLPPAMGSCKALLLAPVAARHLAQQRPVVLDDIHEVVLVLVLQVPPQLASVGQRLHGGVVGGRLVLRVELGQVGLVRVAVGADVDRVTRVVPLVELEDVGVRGLLGGDGLDLLRRQVLLDQRIRLREGECIGHGVLVLARRRRPGLGGPCSGLREGRFSVVAREKPSCSEPFAAPSVPGHTKAPRPMGRRGLKRHERDVRERGR